MAQEWMLDGLGRWNLWDLGPPDRVVTILAPGQEPPDDGIPRDDGGAVNITIRAVTDGGVLGSDAGLPSGDSATGLGLQWPDFGALAEVKEFPWLLLGAGLILVVMASSRHGRR